MTTTEPTPTETTSLKTSCGALAWRCHHHLRSPAGQLHRRELDARDGRRRPRRHDPATGEVLARVPLSATADLDAAVKPRAPRCPNGARSPPSRAPRTLRAAPGTARAQGGARPQGHHRDGQDARRRHRRGRAHDRDGRGRLRAPDDDAGPQPRGRLDQHRRRDRPPAGRRLRGDRALQLPGHGAVLVLAVRHRLRQRVRAQAVRAGPDDPADRLRGPPRAGASARVVNLVNGSREIVEGILDHPGIDAVSFVGSAPVAEIVYERAAKAGKRVQALGGAKNHMVVMPDAVHRQAVEALIGSGFGAAGQRCMAGRWSSRSARRTTSSCRRCARRPRAARRRRPRGRHQRRPRGLARGARPHPRLDRPRREAEGATLVVDGREPTATPAPGRLLRRPDDPRRCHAGDGRRPGGDLRPRAVGHLVGTLDEAIDLVNQPLRQRRVDLHGVRRIGPPLPHESRSACRRQLGVAAPVAFFPFSGWKDSFLGDLHAHGPDAVEFYTKKKTVTSRWYSSGQGHGAYFVEK